MNKKRGVLSLVENIYFETSLKEDVVVDKIVTIHYFEFASDYVFKGEKHDFWELLYVDKGEVEIMADTQGYKLEQGDIVFHKPNEFHSVWANGMTAPNIVVLSFYCSSNGIKFFENKILKLSLPKRNILAEIVREGKESFNNNFGIPYDRLIRRDNQTFGSEQMIKIYLEMLLIQLQRENISNMNKERISFATKERMEGDIVNNIIEYLKENIHENFTFEEICIKFCMGRTHLKTLFKKSTGDGLMAFFRNLKIEEAKKMIREGKNNFTEIAEKLGYTSVHYFSRSFKNCTNMTPSEYVISVKSMLEG